MTKIYLATSGEYSDYRVVGAFTRFEDAEAYELGDDVEEIELHDGPMEVRTWHMAWWSPWEIDFRGVRRWIDHTNRLTERRDYDGDARNASHVWQRKGSVMPRLYVQGWDIDRVDKVLSEQRAQYMAQDDVIHLVPAPGTQQ